MNELKATLTCDECGSLFYDGSSEMASLCPECSHLLYGYENCNHVISNGRCSRCFWDGSTSAYVESLRQVGKE